MAPTDVAIILSFGKLGFGFIKINLSKYKNTDITKEFYRLLDETKDEGVALKVIYDVLKYASKHKDYDIKILQQIPEDYQDKNILIWQMNILQKR